MSHQRLKQRKGLHSAYLPLYEGLCDLLPDSWQPYSGFRTATQQAELYDRGRKFPGRTVTNARPGESPHNYGCATDWTYWEKGQPLWLVKSDERWQTYAQACEKLGLTWGGGFSLVDCPHNELKISVPWRRLKLLGLEQAQKILLGR